MNQNLNLIPTSELRQMVTAMRERVDAITARADKAERIGLNMGGGYAAYLADLQREWNVLNDELTDRIANA